MSNDYTQRLNELLVQVNFAADDLSAALNRAKVDLKNAIDRAEKAEARCAALGKLHALPAFTETILMTSKGPGTKIDTGSELLDSLAIAQSHLEGDEWPEVPREITAAISYAKALIAEKSKLQSALREALGHMAWAGFGSTVDELKKALTDEPKKAKTAPARRGDKPCIKCDNTDSDGVCLDPECVAWDRYNKHYADDPEETS